MVWVIIVVIVLVVVYNISSSSNKVVERVNDYGGMRIKYATLLNHILSGHEDSKVFVETRTYLRAGVANYGGKTIFHIQQSTNNSVIIHYDVTDNPVVAPIHLEWVFPDTMDQDVMFTKMNMDIAKKLGY